MTTEFVRDAAATAAIFGFFGAVWFGWAQEHPPKSWRPWLLTGSVVSLLTMLAGGLLVWRHWSDGSAFDEDTSKTSASSSGSRLSWPVSARSCWVPGAEVTSSRSGSRSSSVSPVPGPRSCHTRG